MIRTEGIKVFSKLLWSRRHIRGMDRSMHHKETNGNFQNPIGEKQSENIRGRMNKK